MSKTIYEVKYEYENGLLVKKICEGDPVTIKYSDDNKVQTWINSKNEVTRVKTFDENGNLIEEKDSVFTRKMEYDNKNRVVRYRCGKDDDINNMYYYDTVYDDINHTSKNIANDDIYINYFDDKNRIIKEERYEKNDSEPYSVITHEYNDLIDICIELSTRLNLNRAITRPSFEMTKYEKFPNTKEYLPVKVLNFAGLEISWEYKFDEDGNVIYEKKIIEI